MQHILNFAILTVLLLATTLSLAADSVRSGGINDLFPSPADPPVPVGEFVEVSYLRTVDGETIEVSMADREAFIVRLFAVDSPELEEGTPEAFESARWLAHQLANAEAVYLEYDEVALTDSFDHALAWVWYEPTVAGEGVGYLVLLNLEQVLGERGDVYPKTQSRRYEDLMVAALAGLAPPGCALKSKHGGIGYEKKLPALELLPEDWEEPEPILASESQPAYDVEITDHGLRWTSSSGSYKRYSWKIELKNNTARKMWVNLYFQLLDDDGFELDKAAMYKKLLPPGTHSFTDDGLLEDYLADQVASYYVSFEERNY